MLRDATLTQVDRAETLSIQRAGLELHRKGYGARDSLLMARGAAMTTLAETINAVREHFSPGTYKVMVEVSVLEAEEAEDAKVEDFDEATLIATGVFVTVEKKDGQLESKNEA